jgi:iron complex transport system ATP-binding protein
MKINNISGGYPGMFSMNDISFEIEEGKMYALLGLNGSGKTTIIRMICGILDVWSGNVFDDVMDILAMNEKRRAKIISYVPQSSSVAYESVLDVVLMGETPYLGAFRTPDKSHVLKAETCLEKLGMEELKNKNYLSLSDGQKKLVIIARALVQDVKYMLFDEPDSSLDLRNRHMLMKKIREITDGGKGCLISMHDPEYALNYCDKILMLCEGKITEIDLAKEEICTVEKKLSSIYGEIKILSFKGRYVMFYGGCDEKINRKASGCYEF